MSENWMPTVLLDLPLDGWPKPHICPWLTRVRAAAMGRPRAEHPMAGNQQLTSISKLCTGGLHSEVPSARRTNQTLDEVKHQAP